MTSPVPARGDDASQPASPTAQPDVKEQNNPYLGRAETSPPTGSALGVEELSTAECWRLLESSSLGRLALTGADGRPDVFPVNFLVHEGSVFIRSAPGAKLRSILANPEVAFEVDGSDVGRHWSVVIRGVARRLDSDAEIEASGILDLVSSSPTPKHNFLRLIPDTVTGRRFRKSRTPGAAAGAHNDRRAAPVPDPEAEGSGEEPSHLQEEKPRPIPHYAPFPH